MFPRHMAHGSYPKNPMCACVPPRKHATARDTPATVFSQRMNAGEKQENRLGETGSCRVSFQVPASLNSAAGLEYRAEIKMNDKALAGGGGPMGGLGEVIAVGRGGGRGRGRRESHSGRVLVACAASTVSGEEDRGNDQIRRIMAGYHDALQMQTKGRSKRKGSSRAQRGYVLWE